MRMNIQDKKKKISNKEKMRLKVVLMIEKGQSVIIVEKETKVPQLFI